MDFAEMGISVLRVLGAGLVFGAGLPALFAVGLTLWSRGHSEVLEDGSVRRGNPIALVSSIVIFVAVIAVVILAVAWITQKSLAHYLGIHIF